MSQAANTVELLFKQAVPAGFSVNRVLFTAVKKQINSIKTLFKHHEN